MRYLHEEGPDREIDQDSEIESKSLRSATASIESDGGMIPVMSVELGDEGHPSNSEGAWQRPKQKRRKITCQEDNEIDAWVKYINGETEKKPEVSIELGHQLHEMDTPRKRRCRYSPTVISDSRQEGAANKPLVLGKCGSVNVPILIDSGTTLHVIGERFVKSLPPKAIIKVDKDESIIRCANDETVKSAGSVTLVVRIGSYSEEMFFSVMPCLFPRVILGIKQMKHSRMVIDPPLDALWVRSEKINFISKTEALNKGN